MILEPVESINKQLIEHFSVAWNGMPIWRIVWSEDQFEKRRTNYSDAGIQLVHPEIRELPKYRQWVQNKFVLERLTVVPEINADELVEKISYEPIYVFENQKTGEALPPNFIAAKFIIDSLNAAMNNESMYAKYVEPFADQPIEAMNEEVRKIEEGLFGNETEVGDALAHKDGIVVPRNYNGN